MILAIDPGTTHSAYCIIDEKTYKPIEYAILPNRQLLDRVWRTDAVIEMFASYGMPVGKEVFVTCVWIGRFMEKIGEENTTLIYRQDVKLNLCKSSRATDANVIMALMDRFGSKGTKKNPGWFYGFKDDIWSAYAIGVTYIDKLKEIKHGRLREAISKH